ncbi:polysaccharide pyruvyl transferase family protein [Microbulbifer sp. CNSA002]|uniref:polysaccharide pyruvyl transferase family protein n=1 Tax=unclassified Microbulbifer TaxID=2619833 RepID=UPI0039B39526
MKWSYVGPGYGKKFFPNDINKYKSQFSGNTGNLIYYFATQCVIDFSGRPMSVGTDTSIFNREGAGIVLSLANQLGFHTDLSKRGLSLCNLNVPVIGLGLGAQVKTKTDDISFIPEGTISWLRDFFERRKGAAITLRGDYTLSLMEKLGFSNNVVSIGCQTNFISSDKRLGENIYKKICGNELERINIAAGSPFNKELRSLEASLLRMAVQSGGDYIVQHPESFISLAANFSDDDFEKSFEKIFPAFSSYGFSEAEFRGAVRKNFRLYNDAVNWMLSHRSTDVVVGTRIHGVQSAIQSGVPAICLYIDSRTHELCEKMKIPHVSASSFEAGISKSQIESILKDWDFEEFDRNRLELAKKMEKFLDDNSVPLGRSLKALVD